MGIESILTPRLQAIAKSVPANAVVADVGTDHGYVPIYLCQTKQINKALAMDLRPGPLSRAQKNIERFGLSEQISTRLSNGLQALQPGEADTAVVAGMGGLLIAQILEEAPFFLEHYILQPMTATAELREWLEANGYSITNELLAREENKIYTVMTVRRGPMKIEKPVYYLVGERLLENRDPLAPALIDGLLRKYRQTLQGLASARREDLQEKQETVSEIIQALKELQEVCATW